VLRINATPILIFLLAGALDWLTTIIGVVGFGAVESNPFVADVAGSNLPLFVALKLPATTILGLFFYLGERMILKAHDKNTVPFQYARIILKTACIAVSGLLLIVVMNNLIVIARLL